MLSTPVAQNNAGAVQGVVTFVANGERVHGAIVVAIGTDYVGVTNENGEFLLEDVPAGTYAILTQREHLTTERQTIVVKSGQVTTVNFSLDLSPIHEDITVTTSASGKQTTTFEAFNATDTIDSFDLAINPTGTVAEVLDNLPGVATRGFGPGSTRPIIRGFDGDRVLVMEDGIGTGDLSSSSTDHGMGIDPNGLERLEIVRGPATLLYGSNAIGGVVNAITPGEALRGSAISGTRGQVSLDGGSANAQAGTFANVVHGNSSLHFWVGGGARRTSDYDSPESTITNSGTKLFSGRVGFGYAGDKLFSSGNFTFSDERFGVPEAGRFHANGHEEEHGDEDHELFVDIDSVRRVGRFDVGIRNLDNSVIDSFKVVTNVIDYQHNEIESKTGLESVGTMLNNRSYVVRADVMQQSIGNLNGRFGLWTKIRDFKGTGEEALAPSTEQISTAVFVYEELDFGRFQMQFGGRLERNDYTVGKRSEHEEHGHEEHCEETHGYGDESPAVRNRSFLGGSASIGLRVELTSQNAFVANLTRSHRPPSLEELYNFGAHIGNLTYEIGNPNLHSESTIGLDLSLRHLSGRVRGDINAYIYEINDFVFFDVENEIISGLPVAKFMQGSGRFIGFDGKASLQLLSGVWANFGVELVNAELTSTGESLPRIPPVRGKLSVDVPYQRLTITPEWIFAARQSRVFRNETVTDGYSLFNLRASYVRPMSHMAHIVSVTAYNLTNTLYRHHTSVIKDFVPQIGRGVKVGYSLRFF